MDGSDVSVIVAGLVRPNGLAIDFHSSSLYWTGNSKVQSCSLQGTNVQTLIELPTGSVTHGITLFSNRIYFTTWASKKLQSLTTAGTELRELHTDTSNVFNLAIMSSRPDLPRNRTNHCANQKCPKLCVLTGTSFRCVPWEYSWSCFVNSAFSYSHVMCTAILWCIPCKILIPFKTSCAWWAIRSKDN